MNEIPSTATFCDCGATLVWVSGRLMCPNPVCPTWEGGWIPGINSPRRPADYPATREDT